MLVGTFEDSLTQSNQLTGPGVTVDKRVGGQIVSVTFRPGV